jgi:hypothetical protein
MLFINMVCLTVGLTFPPQNYDCIRSGPPPLGVPLEIKWTDDLLYGGVYRGCHTNPMVQVEFEDGSELR